MNVQNGCMYQWYSAPSLSHTFSGNHRLTSIYIDNIEVRQVDIRPVYFGQSLSRMTCTSIAVNADVVKGCLMGLGCEERVYDQVRRAIV
jgi:hypothetical protein